MASTAWSQRLSGVKRPILKARTSQSAAARTSAAAAASTGCSAEAGMPLGITSGLTPNDRIRCFMYRLTVVIAAT